MAPWAKALGAGAAALILIAAVVAVQADHHRNSPIHDRALGPANESFAFAADPAGRAGPADGCVVCHSVSKDGPMRSAPGLWGIVGAPKARSEWFAYSAPLRKKGGVWSEEELDGYLAKPSGFLPGTSKTLPPIEDPARRKTIISYLKSLQG